MISLKRVSLALVLLSAVVASPLLAIDVGGLRDIERDDCRITVEVEADNSGTYAVEVFNPSNGVSSRREFVSGGAGTYAISFNLRDINPPVGAQGALLKLSYFTDGDFESVDSATYGDIPGECDNPASGQPISISTSDGRLNRQAYATAIVVCKAERIIVYKVANGEGFYAFEVSLTDLTPSTEPSVIAAGHGAQLERLQGGALLVNGGVGADGKVYLFEFDGCPATYGQAYIVDNGVLTPTERVRF